MEMEGLIGARVGVGVGESVGVRIGGGVKELAGVTKGDGSGVLDGGVQPDTQNATIHIKKIVNVL